MKTHAFQALRPSPEHADRVATVPYDTVDTTEARAIARGNPHSFMHVIRPEIALPDDASPTPEQAGQLAAEALKRLVSDGMLVREERPRCYVYRQIMGDHTQAGVVACCHIDDYINERVMKHERTRPDKEDDRTRHVLAVNAHTGPVFLTYRDADSIDALCAATMASEPLFDLTTDDGVRHTVWHVLNEAAMVQAFGDIERVYIADGHHRSAAAARAGIERRNANPDHSGDEEYNWFMAVLFGSRQLNILPYNRLIRDLNGYTADALLAALEEHFTLTAGASPTPSAPHHASMYLAGSWHDIGWPAPQGNDPIATLDVAYLQEHLLGPILGIDDPRTSSRITFVGGIRGTDELERRVNDGSHAIAFSVNPVSVDAMMDIADAGLIMPPKSTWFEPKLRSGLFVHTLD